jgi:hypothetical protein
MDSNPICPTCGAIVDLTRPNAVTPVIYRNVACRNCGVICILEGPERNVIGSRDQFSSSIAIAVGR